VPTGARWFWAFACCVEVEGIQPKPWLVSDQVCSNYLGASADLSIFPQQGRCG
jgi:hypothetical protein